MKFKVKKMKKKRRNNFKDFSLFLAIAVLVFIAGCTGVTPSDPIINSFSASPSTITAGESSTLSWIATDATSISIDPDVGSVALTGNTSVSPTTTTTYTLTATNASGSVSATTTVTVGSAVTVTYYGNGHTGGSVPTDSTVYKENDTVTILDKGDLVKTGYLFTGWNTKADGSGTDQAEGSTFTIGTSNVTLYAQWTPYTLRDIGPAGGYIFYDKGSYSGSPSWRYLEAAPESTEWTGKQWGCHGTSIPGADGTAVGTGMQNTTDIVAECTTVGIAADICANLDLGGYSDWFLPSKDELNLMYENLHDIVTPVGGFSDSSYWSSSEDVADRAWTQYFFSGNQGNYYKYDSFRVRAVRAF